MNWNFYCLRFAFFEIYFKPLNAFITPTLFQFYREEFHDSLNITSYEKINLSTYALVENTLFQPILMPYFSQRITVKSTCCHSLCYGQLCIYFNSNYFRNLVSNMYNLYCVHLLLKRILVHVAALSQLISISLFLEGESGLELAEQ